MSFLPVVLGFDGISAERERGTLRQMLTNPVPRTYIVLAKLLGGTLSLIFPFAIAFGVSLLIMLANPDVDLSHDDWLRLVLLFLLSCVFLAQAFSLSLMVSVLARNSDISLIICLFGWLVFGVGYLNVVPSLSRYLVYEPPCQVFQDQSARLYADYDREMADWDRRNLFSVGKLLELADAGYRYRWANQEPLARQAHVVDDWAKTLRDVADRWYRIQSNPVGTEFIAEGGFNWAYTGQWVNPRSGQTMWTSLTRTTNNWMRRFEVVDWVVIGRYVLSFLCIVLAYNAVSGERENGTLLLAMANPVARAEFLIAKFLAHFVILEVTLVLGCAISLAALVGTGVLEFNAQIARGCCLFLVCISLLVSLFLLLAIGISALAGTSASALVFLVSMWTVLMVVIPQSSYLIAVRSVESVGPYWEELDSIRETFEESVRRDGLTPRDATHARLDDYDVERRYAMRVAAMERGLDAVRRRVDQQMFQQYQVARTVNLLSPGYAFQYSMEAFLGTRVQRARSFLRQRWRYRDALRDFIHSKDSTDPDSPHLLYVPGFLSTRSIDSTLIPRFHEAAIPLPRSLSGGILPIALLVLEICVAFIFALWAFNRTDFSG